MNRLQTELIEKETIASLKNVSNEPTKMDEMQRIAAERRKRDQKAKIMAKEALGNFSSTLTLQEELLMKPRQARLQERQSEREIKEGMARISNTSTYREQLIRQEREKEADRRERENEFQRCMNRGSAVLSRQDLHALEMTQRNREQRTTMEKEKVLRSRAGHVNHVFKGMQHRKQYPFAHRQRTTKGVKSA